MTYQEIYSIINGMRKTAGGLSRAIARILVPASVVARWGGLTTAKAGKKLTDKVIKATKPVVLPLKDNTKLGLRLLNKGTRYKGNVYGLEPGPLAFILGDKLWYATDARIKNRPDFYKYVDSRLKANPKSKYQGPYIWNQQADKANQLRSKAIMGGLGRLAAPVAVPGVGYYTGNLLYDLLAKQD